MTATTTEPPKGVDIERAFQLLCKAIQNCKIDGKKADAEAQMRIAAHIKHVTGGKITSLGVYHAQDGITDEIKKANYKLCFNALITNKGEPDWSQLDGQPGAGAKLNSAPETETPPARVTRPAATSNPPQAETVAPPKREVKMSVTLPAGTDTAKAADGILAALLERISGLQGNISEQQVEAIVRRVIADNELDFKGKVIKAINNGAFPVDRVKELTAHLVSKEDVLEIVRQGVSEMKETIAKQIGQSIAEALGVDAK